MSDPILTFTDQAEWESWLERNGSAVIRSQSLQTRTDIFRLCIIGVVTLLLSGCASEHDLNFVKPNRDAPIVLAHRGVSQTFDAVGVTDATCTASRIYPPKHRVLENTIESIDASIKLGASVVEIDVHPTTDGEFAVFHDWTLECRTNGTGRTRDHSMSYLKSLDIGYGYTADHGKSFPFRGKAIGQMPSLKEVLVAFPQQPLLVNIKSKDPAEGERLAAYLAELPKARRELIAVYGAEEPIKAVRAQVPGILTMSRESLKSCLIGYLLVGWSGAIPKSCERTVVLVPINYSTWLWGWPATFIKRMEAAGSAVFVLGAYHSGPSQGIDTVEELNKLPQEYKGGIWTNELELISSALSKNKSSVSKSPR